MLNNSTNVTTTDNDNADAEKGKYEYKPDVYFVIGAVSFIIFVILCVAIYKAIVMLKISLNDGIDDTIPVETNDNNLVNGKFLEKRNQSIQSTIDLVTLILVKNLDLVNNLGTYYLYVLPNFCLYEVKTLSI